LYAGNAPPRVSARELLLAAVAVAAAVVARAWAPDGIGINHFDEGVYVISALGVAEPGRGLFPNQVVFSPAFYFSAAGLSYLLFGGAPDRAAVMVNIVLGTLTVAAVWWVGRAWFGARAALIAATMLAFSQFHILLSRVALTDVAFAFWFVLALGAIVRAVDSADYRLAVPAGILTGLAWNTKYHGWFALVISGAALVPTLWTGRKDGSWRRPIGIWLTICVTAGLLYLPWAVILRDATADGGGYGAIIRYFAAMLRGSWLSNLIRHATQQAYLEGALSRTAPLAALGVGLLMAGVARQAATRVSLIAFFLAVLSLLIGQSGVALLLALALLPLLRREFGAYRSRVLLCWIGLWIVAAPFYQPYPRLLLPFTIATLLLAGAMLDRMLAAAASAPRTTTPEMPSPVGALACLVAAVGLFVGSRTLRDDVGDPWRATRSHAVAAERIDKLVPQGARVYVIGEPTLVHYLQQRGRDVPLRVQAAEIDRLAPPAYLVTGVYVDRAPPLRNRVNRNAGRFTRVAELPFDPNDLRLLDDLRARAARRFRAARDTTFDLTLYRVDR
jgi:4-amino-4-deoxy-L-arabinose transferase-like glycosyltransferase